MSKPVRVRFAPSPTGGLHLGGIRTALYNYLFAKKNNGIFIVRTEDTDQNRLVQNAEEYIFNCLKWCGIEPDESSLHGGIYAPYKQSERKEIYKKYAQQLINQGHAYYAFDTSEELEQMRNELKTKTNPSPQYDELMRNKMRNSLTISVEETEKLLAENLKNVIRLKIPKEKISFIDLIKGNIEFNTDILDDKILIKADGMPTYHLAVVVDDYLMKISHAFRGEEWLPSAPVHILLWKYLFGLDQMPQWAHLPLILGPSGKLSKRDGAKFGFPVYALNWANPQLNDFNEGFNEKGFLPQAFINFLALLGWNDGTDQEIYSKEELIKNFSIERVQNHGAKFDYEKAKWFNHEWIKKLAASDLLPMVNKLFDENNIVVHEQTYLLTIIELIKDRCTLLTDFIPQASYFFQQPLNWNLNAVNNKWNEEKKDFFISFKNQLLKGHLNTAEEIENEFKNLAINKNLKAADFQLPLRIMLVGDKLGPQVFKIAELIGLQDTVLRIENFLNQI